MEYKTLLSYSYSDLIDNYKDNSNVNFIRIINDKNEWIKFNTDQTNIILSESYIPNKYFIVYYLNN